ncbi:MAG: hypothetical protein WC980_04160 [Candidatus Brocadiia bacterium]
MPFTKKFELRLYVAPNREVAGDMPDRWVEGLSNNTGRIYDRLTAKVPDDGTFFDTLANPSTNGYEDVLNPAYRTRGGRTTDIIKAMKHQKMAKAYERWFSRLTQKMSANNGQAFKTEVANAKDWWAIKASETTLRLTGDKVRGRGPAPVATFWLVGDRRAKSWVPVGDFLDGSPYSIARDGEEPALKTALQQKLIQGGLFVDFTGNNAAVIAAQNGLNVSLLNGFRDTAKCDIFVTTTGADKCFCLWEVDTEGRLNLHVQVGITV